MKNTVVCALAAVAALVMAGSASAAIEFDQLVTPDVIFGSGNANGSFTTDRAGGVELGLRGKLRHNGAGAPENTFNSNGAGTYTFHAGVAPTQSFPTAEWSFEWSINSDYLGTSGNHLSDYTYVLGIDTNPDAVGTSFITFDPINDSNPNFGEVRWDHAIGNNSTGNGGGGNFVASEAIYDTALDGNNVAQNSWKPHWFIPGFNPNAVGIYDFYLEAYDVSGLVARTEMQVSVVPLPGAAALGFLGIGLISLRRRFQKTQVVA